MKSQDFIKKEFLIRELARKSILSYTRYIFERVYNKPFKEAWFHGYIAELYKQVFLGNIPEFLINIPPAYGKTAMTTIAMTWKLGHTLSSKFIYTSYSADLSIGVSKEARMIVSHPAFKLLFPNIELSKEQDSKQEWETTHLGGMFATSTGGVVTGKHATGGGVFIDDPIKASEKNSRSALQASIDFYTDSLVSRDKDFIGCIMQRLNSKDLAGYLIKNEDFYHLNLKALESRPIIYEIGTFKYQREANEVLYEAKENLAQVQKKMKSLGSSASAQYQQDPDTMEGDFYTDSTFSYCGEIDVPTYEQKHIIIDPAMSQRETADNRAIVPIGISQDTDKLELFIVHDVFYGIWGFDEFINMIIDVMIKYPDAPVWIELGGGGHLIVQELRKAVIRKNTELKEDNRPIIKNRINTIPAKKAASKNGIIEACEPYFLTGQIKFKRTASGLEQLKKEFKSFDPAKDSPEDDCMECVAIAVTNPDIKAGKKAKKKKEVTTNRRKKKTRTSWKV